MTFYQELQLNQAGSKNLLKKSETLKEKLYHMWVYLVKIVKCPQKVRQYFEVKIVQAAERACCL